MTVTAGSRDLGEVCNVPIFTHPEVIKILLGNGVKVWIPAMFTLIPPNLALQNHKEFLLGEMKWFPIEIGVKAGKLRGTKGASASGDGHIWG